MRLWKSGIVGFGISGLALLNSPALAALMAMNGLASSRLHEHVQTVLSRAERGENPSPDEYATCLGPIRTYLARVSAGNDSLFALAGIGFSVVGLLLNADRFRENPAGEKASSRTSGVSDSPGAP
jgi:hypothetical protein